MEALNVTVSVRVESKTKRRIAKEVRDRRKHGHRVNGADITREAIIEYFARRDKNQKTSLTE